MGRKGVVAGFGDSLWLGFNSTASQEAPLGENGYDNVSVYNRYTSANALVRLGVSDDFTPGWDPLTYSGSNWQQDGPCPMYWIANAMARYLGLEELRVIMMGASATDIVQSPPGANPNASWYSGLSGGLYDKFADKYAAEALATPEITTDHEFLGFFTSLGNNLNNPSVYPTDETTTLASNLTTTIAAAELLFVASGHSRQVVSGVPIDVRDNELFSLDRMLESRRQMDTWKAASSETLPRAYSSTDGLESTTDPDDPHLTDIGTMGMGKRMFHAWRSAGQNFPNIDV